MKKLILGLTVVLSFLSCGKEGKTDELPAELPAPEEEIDVTDTEIEEPSDVGLGRERR